jgi:hypothetical protein
VNMFRSASPFHPGLCTVLHLLSSAAPPFRLVQLALDQVRRRRPPCARRLR